MKQYVERLKNLYSDETFKRKLGYIEHNISPFINTNDHAYKVLEIGPGMGELIYFLNINNLKDIDIVDNDKSILSYIRKNFYVKNSFFSQSILNLRKKLRKYDLIILIQVLEHLPTESYTKTVKILYDLLKPNGFLIIVVPNANNPLGLVERYGDLQHFSSFTTQSLIDLAMSAGISKEKIEIRGYEIPLINALNIIRTVAQKILHIFLYLILCINGGVFYKPLTPNIMLKISK